MFQKTLDNIFSIWNMEDCPGGQVVVRHNGRVLFNKCYGYANLENHIPVTRETVFHAASVTKQFTCFCALLLHQYEKLDINDDIRQYVPDLVLFPQPVTLRNLMNNVSGIRDQWELLTFQGIRLTDEISQKDVLCVLKSQKELNCNPLTEYRYSNSNFTLLAEIIERVSGQKLNSFAKEHIFAPLGMESTRIVISAAEIVDNLADSYFCNGDEYFVHPIQFGNYGATSLKSNTRDFLKWFDELKNPTLLSEDNFSLFTEVPTLNNGQKTGYASGILIGEISGHAFLAHGGSDASYRSSVLCFPEDDLDIAVFSNSSILDLSNCTTRIASEILGFDIPKLSENSQFFSPKHNKDAIEGMYYFTDSSGMVLINEVYKSAGKYYLKNEIADRLLTHIDGNCYQVGFLPYRFYFGETPGMAGLSATAVPLIRFDEKHHHDSRLPGNYYCPELKTMIHIFGSGDQIFLQMNRSIKYRLFSINDQGTYIFGNVIGATIQVNQNTKSEIIEFTLSGSRALYLKFIRVKGLDKLPGEKSNE